MSSFSHLCAARTKMRKNTSEEEKNGFLECNSKGADPLMFDLVAKPF